MSAVTAKQAVIDCIRTLRNQHGAILVATSEAAKCLETDQLEKRRHVMEDSLLDATDAVDANRVCQNGVLEMWKLAASNLVDATRPSRLTFYRLLFMDHWLLGVSCSKSYKRISLRLDNLRDRNLMLTPDEVLNGYSDIVKDAVSLLVHLQSSRLKLINFIATFCGISGVSTAILVVWIIQAMGD